METEDSVDSEEVIEIHFNHKIILDNLDTMEIIITIIKALQATKE
jgi:hypothetical protein